MAGWKYENGKWTDPSGKSYNLNAPNLLSKLKASGLSKYAGAAGLGALLGSLMNKGGSGGSSAKIPQLMASRQQYAVPLTGPRSTYNPTDEEIRNYVSRPGMTDAMVARGMNQFRNQLLLPELWRQNILVYLERILDHCARRQRDHLRSRSL